MIKLLSILMILGSFNTFATVETTLVEGSTSLLKKVLMADLKNSMFTCDAGFDYPEDYGPKDQLIDFIDSEDSIVNVEETGTGTKLVVREVTAVEGEAQVVVTFTTSSDFKKTESVEIHKYEIESKEIIEGTLMSPIVITKEEIKTLFKENCLITHN